MLEKMLAYGIVAIIFSVAVSLINRARNKAKWKSLSYKEISSEYELWDQLAQGSAWFGNNYMTKERFDSLSINDKVQILIERFGSEKD